MTNPNDPRRTPGVGAEPYVGRYQAASSATYFARCPGCGADCEWHVGRDGAQSTPTPLCPCDSPAVSGSGKLPAPQGSAL